jgi:SAM-dependent methyltransferase
VRTVVADGEHLPDYLGPFDAVVCRLGLMLFADPLQGLREMHRVLRPDGGICTVVFSRAEKNPCVAILLQLALQHAGLPPRQPFQAGWLLSLGQPGFIDGLFEQAGFRQVATTAIEAPFELPSARHYLDFVHASASPIQQVLSRLDRAAQEAAWDDMELRLRAFDTAHGWVGPNELLLTAARR